ncbi:Plasma membrane t-SNARE, secretory vesicle fusion [Podila minutissima]|nr:Plasma membrane t-SNARE, secretory vesicle fusion [Podila minutissima]
MNLFDIASQLVRQHHPQYQQYGQQQQQQQQQQYGGQQYGAQGQFAQQAQYTPPQQQQQYPPVVIPMSNVSNSNEGSFFTEVTSIQEEIARVNQNIDRIEQLHDQSVNAVASEEQASHLARQLEGITADTTQLSNRIKKRIKDIELTNLRNPNSADIELRRTQAATLKQKFLTTLRRFQNAESEARKKYQGRMERQYKIVKPDATAQEIQQVLASDNQQIFAQSVLQSSRYGDANRALREVQTRHDDIKKIERTITVPTQSQQELHQLFVDMETLVTEQAEVINVIDDNTQKTDTHLHDANNQIDIAIDNAEGARRKKWICLFITIIIIAILAIVLTKALKVW